MIIPNSLIHGKGPDSNQLQDLQAAKFFSLVYEVRERIVEDFNLKTLDFFILLYSEVGGQNESGFSCALYWLRDFSSF